jgi:hypothetical protein
MHDGKLLAMDSPSALKQHYLPGLAWDVFAKPLLPALAVLEQSAYVLRAGLTSDHLRAITPRNIDDETLNRSLMAASIQVERIELVEPTLEDVFLAMADSNGLPAAEEKPV